MQLQDGGLEFGPLSAAIGEADRQYYLDLLRQVIRRYGWIIIEPVRMTNRQSIPEYQ